MDEYIKRDDALLAISYYPIENPEPDDIIQAVLETARKSIARINAADVSPVRHGRWLFVTAGQMTSAWCCSECGKTVVITCDEELRQSKIEKEYPFCHCGAKMDLEE